MADTLFQSAKLRLMNGGIDLDTDPLYIMLVNGYSPVANTHTFRSDVTNECPASGNYTTGGIALAGSTVSAAAGVSTFDATTDPSWASATISATGAVIYKRVGADLTTPADDPIICFLDFGGTKTSTAGTFTVQFNASGILTLT